MIDEFCNAIPPLAQSPNKWWMPHGHCVLWEPWITWTWTVCDVLIWLSYLAIPAILFVHLRTTKLAPVLPWIAPFVLACGFGHLWDAVAIWWPYYALVTASRTLTAVVSVASVVGLWATLRKHSKNIPDYLNPRDEAQVFVDSLSPAAVFLWDDEIGDYAINAGYPRILGRTIDEVRGRGYLDWVHPDDMEIADKGWSEFVADKSRDRCLLRFRWQHRLGQITVEVEGRRRPGGQTYGIVRDVSREIALLNMEERI